MLYQLSYSWLAKKNSHMPPNHVPKAVDILGVSCETANGSNVEVNYDGKQHALPQKCRMHRTPNHVARLSKILGDLC